MALQMRHLNRPSNISPPVEMLDRAMHHISPSRNPFSSFSYFPEIFVTFPITSDNPLYTARLWSDNSLHSNTQTLAREVLD